MNPDWSVSGTSGVLVVFSDKHIPMECDNGEAAYFVADVMQATDYSPFGVILENREWYADKKYRAGFNGKDRDDEIGGEGDIYNFEGRVYNALLGRWFSPDPKEGVFSGISTYSFSFDNPIIFNDPDGKNATLTVVKNADGKGGTVTLETTVYLYGPDAPNVTLQSTEATADVKDSEGNTWKVTVKVNYVYDKTIAAKVEGMNIPDDKFADPSSLVGTEGDPIPNTEVKRKFTEGDNILLVDENKPVLPNKPDVNGAVLGTGGSTGKVKTTADRTIFHEAGHFLGFDERYSNFGLTTPHEGFNGDFMAVPQLPGASPYPYDAAPSHFADVLDKALQMYSASKPDNSTPDPNKFTYQGRIVIDNTHKKPKPPANDPNFVSVPDVNGVHEQNTDDVNKQASRVTNVKTKQTNKP